LRDSLEQICKGLGDRVVFDPIHGGESAGRYIFESSLNNKLLVMKKDGATYSEIDELLLIDNLPVLFEIKLSIYKGRRGNVTQINPGKRGVKHAMNVSRINFMLNPIKSYFQSRCGYVLVVYPEQITSRSPLQAEFINQGGILRPFYTDRETYRKIEIPRIKQEYSI